MRTANRLPLSLLFVAIMTLTTGAHSETAVVIDHIDGINQSGQIMAGQPVTMYFSFVSDSEAVRCATLGHELSSPDGATWSAPVIEAAAPMLSSYWDLALFFTAHNADGVSPDTLSFSGIKLFQAGLPFGFSDPIYKISFDVDKDQLGKTICIDSSWFPNAGTWDWLLDSGDIAPDWGGPYCFDIVSCCDGSTGDANLDGSTNVGDVSYLVEYLFLGGPLACIESGNANGETTGDLVNVADLAWMVAYLFQGGPPPAACR